MSRDFTIDMYRGLLNTLVETGYSFYTFSEWCKTPTMHGKTIILRHDVDKNPENALRIAVLEKEFEIKSTYYFLIKKTVFNAPIIKKIADLGHEIGYHYRDLVDANNDREKAIELFYTNIKKIREVAPVDTIAMDGCPWSKYDNRNLWNIYNYRDYGIIGEPYFDFLNREDIKVRYFTDTARMWNGDKYNVRDKRRDVNSEQSDIHSTPDLIKWLKESDNQFPIMLTTHPQRWTNHKGEWLYELLSQTIKNKIKQAFFIKKQRK